MSTLILDCDGVLADTERYGHLPAFNQTFEEFRLPVRWSEEEYGRRLLIGGGKERMASLLTPEFVAATGLPPEREQQLEQVSRWHQRKTAIYTQMVAEGKLPPRPGIARLVAATQDRGWHLAVASTSAEASVHAILEYAVGEERARRFDVVLAGDCVPHKKPAPDIYQLALERLGVPAGEAVVVEDSRNGLLSAGGAGLRCIITVTGYTAEEDFEGALMVLSSLGDPELEPIQVLANRTSARLGDYVTLEDLETCLAA